LWWIFENDRFAEDAVPEEPIPEQDPVVTKSYAMYYVVCMVILMVTYFGRCG
jgi:hypothetical protein